MAKELNISVNMGKSYLSSETKIYKTERCFFAARKIANFDLFLMNVAESFLPYIEELEKQLSGASMAKRAAADIDADAADGKVYIDCFRVETLDKQFSFLMTLGKAIKNIVKTDASFTLDEDLLLVAENINDKDIIFFADFSEYKDLKSNDMRVNNLLKLSKMFNILVKNTEAEINIDELKKLYLVSGKSVLNMPMLSKKQCELVEIENKNVLVQGVAGSGKTNICLSKIIFAACRNYTGKVLYTTFSRGLVIDTKNKLEAFKNNVMDFIEDYQQNRLIFLDKNHKKAIENRLGLNLPDNSDINILKLLKQIVNFIEHNVDLYLLEDLYKIAFGQEFKLADEKIFFDEFLKSLGNHQLKGKTEKLKNISMQIVYREIYGKIFGSVSGAQANALSKDKYTELQAESFDKSECEIIYDLAMEYDKFKKSQGYVDNNDISRRLLEKINSIPNYSLTILDEVQDFTEINLKLFESLSLKLMCVGDALQMINPAYFNFAYLKNLMYRDEITEVAELQNNYRNNQKIAELLNKLGEINIKEFGTHSFVISSSSIDKNSLTNVVLTRDEEFLNKLKKDKFENFTIIASSTEQKQTLKEKFARQEVLSVSEIKGLERDTVLLVNILSDYKQKWEDFNKIKISHKKADENSVYRYYFNLLYVAVSRAKHNIFVFERENISVFEEFFNNGFENLNGKDAYERFTELISKIEIDDDDLVLRVNELIKLGQFENARFYISRFEDSNLSYQMHEKIDAYEQFVFKGKNREAGIKLWKAGLLQEAKMQFEISGDSALIDFMNNLDSKNASNLDASIVKVFTEFEENKEAQKLIIEVLNQDINSLNQKHLEIKSELKQFKEKRYGK